MSRQSNLCPGCGVPEGQFHGFYCRYEVCPFCGGLVQTCSCKYQQLGLIDPSKYGPETGFMEEEYFVNGLTQEQKDQWHRLVCLKGKVPYDGKAGKDPRP